MVIGHKLLRLNMEEKKSNDSSHSLVHVELVVAICNYIERKKERNDELK